MSEENGPVEGAEPTATPEAPEVSTPEPSERSTSNSEALERALKSISERETKPEGDDRPRTPDGKFAPKPEEAPEKPAEPQVAEEVPEPAETEEAPPARLRDDVKASWKDLPPNVRNDFTRITGELEKGLNQYREQIEPFKPFLEATQRNGIDPVAWLDRATQLDRACSIGPVQGVDALCKMLNVDMRALAAHVMGQPEPTVDARVTQLRQENQHLQQENQQLQRFKTDADARTQAETAKTVEAFATKHPRFDELAKHITWQLEAGAPDLETAYRMAELLNPAPAAQTRTPEAQTLTPAPQTSKAGLSLDGAPGTNAGTPVKSKSNREALQRAAAKAGLSL